MAQPSVLVVEDEELVRANVVEALLDEGFLVWEASTGEEAMEVVESATDILMLFADIGLPGAVDGVQLARKIRGHQPALPIVFATSRPEVIKRMTKRGAQMTEPTPVILVKPYQTSDVVKLARAALAAYLAQHPSASDQADAESLRDGRDAATDPGHRTPDM
jgi:CheY-like chemotaxis protein